MFEYFGKRKVIVLLFALSLFSPISKASPDNVLELLKGTKYLKEGKLSQSEGIFRNIISSYIENSTKDKEYASACGNLGLILQRTGRLVEAEKWCTEAVSIAHKTYGPYNSETLSLMNNLGTVYIKKEEYKKAESLLKEVLSIKKSLKEDSSISFANTLENLATALNFDGLPHEAEKLQVASISIKEKLCGSTSLDVLGAKANLANIHRNEDRLGEAENIYKSILNKTQPSDRKSLPIVAQVLENLGEIYYVRHNYRKSRDMVSRALGIDRALYGNVDLRVAGDLNSLGMILTQMKHFDSALKAYEESLRIYNQLNDVRSSRYQTVLENLESLKKIRGKRN